jgi:hypothetical protein
MQGIRASILMTAGALLCAGLAVPAHAQDDEGRAASRKESTRMMLGFAECTVRSDRSRPKVDRFLRMSPSNPEFTKLGNEFIKDRCVPPSTGSVTMKFDSLLFRYSLFEARYRIEFGKSPPPKTDDLPPIDIAGEFDPRGANLPDVVVFLRKLGECSIRFLPAEAHAFVLALPYSDAEGVALQGLMPALGECMPEGQTLKFSRPMLRGAIAEALYKAAKYTGPRVAPAPTQSVN